MVMPIRMADGMASGGVQAPDNNRIGMSNIMPSMVICAMLLLMVAMNKPMPDVVNTYKAVTAKNNPKPPFTGK